MRALALAVIAAVGLLVTLWWTVRRPAETPGVRSALPGSTSDPKATTPPALTPPAETQPWEATGAEKLPEGHVAPPAVNPPTPDRDNHPPAAVREPLNPAEHRPDMMNPDGSDRRQR